MLKKIQNLVFSPLFIALLVAGSLLFRYYSLPAMTSDMEDGLFRWYGFILKRGFQNAFKENFALYTPPYLYLLALGTLVDGIVSRITLIKLISMVFDLVSAFFVFKLTWLKYPKTNIPFLAAALTFALPTVMLNSAYWGQCDGIYTAFLLGCVYFVLTERPWWGVFFFAVAFAFKLQSIFLLPFLGAYTLRGKIPWYSFGLIPLVYGVLAIPTILAERPWLDVLTIYAHQTDKFPKWSSTTPTLYLPLEGRVLLTESLSNIVVIGAGIVFAVWMFFTWRRQQANGHAFTLLAALASVGMVPFLLPRMHQRYFYPQDLFALVIAFFRPELWFLPILSQIISVIAYGPYLFGTTFRVPFFGRNLNALYYVALPLEIILLVIVLWKQFKSSEVETCSDH